MIRYTPEIQERIDSLQHNYRLAMGYDAVRKIEDIFLQAYIYAGLTASDLDPVFSVLADKMAAEFKARVSPVEEKSSAAKDILGEFEARVNAAVDNPDNAELFR